MAINIRKGVTRIWVVLTLLILTVTLILSYESTTVYLRNRNTIELHIKVPEVPDLTVRLSTAFSSLSKDDQSIVVDRVFTLLGYRAAIDQKCDLIQRQLNSRSIPLPSRLPLSELEVSTIKQAFPEYADLNDEQLKNRLEDKLAGCVGQAKANLPLPANLELIAGSAFKCDGPGSLVPLAIGGAIVGTLWLTLFAAMWVIAGFRQSSRSA